MRIALNSIPGKHPAPKATLNAPRNAVCAWIRIMTEYANDQYSNRDDLMNLLFSFLPVANKYYDLEKEPSPEIKIIF